MTLEMQKLHDEAKAFLHSAVDGFMEQQAKLMTENPEDFAGADAEDFNVWFTERL